MEKKVKKVVLCKNYKLHNYKPLPMAKKGNSANYSDYKTTT